MAKKKPTVIDTQIDLNPEQDRIAAAIMDPRARYILAIAGTGLGKTFAIMSIIFDRALVAPGSRHLCLRSQLNDCRDFLFNMTAKDVLEAKFGVGTWEEWRENLKSGRTPSISTSPLKITMPNGSEIMFRGYDDVNADRVLGPDLATVFINEVSLFDDPSVVSNFNTRLRQKVTTDYGKELRVKFIADCNPPSKRHWTYSAFHNLTNPVSGVPHQNPEAWVHIKGDVTANRANLSQGYLEAVLEDCAGDRIKYARYVQGDWYDELENPLFRITDIAAARVEPITPEEAASRFTSIVINVDPAGSSGAKSDETGITVMGVDSDDPDVAHAYVLADLSGKYQPKEWAKIVRDQFHLWKADWIIAEKNFGGDMVAANLRTQDSTIPIMVTTSSRGKEVRAEATSTAYSQHRVHHAGHFPELESQLLEYELKYNRRTRKSPDRLDSIVFGINFLLVTEKKRNGASYSVAAGIW